METEHFEEHHSETSTIGDENGKMSSVCRDLPRLGEKKPMFESNDQAKSYEEHGDDINQPSHDRGLQSDSCHSEQQHLTSVWERSLSAIYYELHTLNQTTIQLAEAVNSCAHSMYFFTKSMLDFQSEMTDINNKISSSLRMAVGLLEENVRNVSFPEATRPSAAASKSKPSHEDCRKKRRRERGRSSSGDYTPSPCKKERY